MIKNIRTSLKRINVRAVFSICADNQDIIVKKSLKDTICFSLKPEEFDYTHHFVEAVKRGISEFKPDFISTTADDFIIPSKRFSNMIKPLLGKCDLTFASWGSQKVADSYPKFQYVSELFVSRIINIASSKSSITNQITSYTFDYKKDFSNIIQLFTGLFAMKTYKWNSVLSRIMEIYGSTKLGWSLEVLVLFLGHDMGLKIMNAPCDRFKEGNSPVKGERFTRIKQMEDVFRHTKHYLEFTKQFEKLNKITKIQSEMIGIVNEILNKSGA